MKKRMASFLLAMVLMLGMLPVMTLAGDSDESDTYYTVTFDYNYGNRGAYLTVRVKAGETVAKPKAPYRGGIMFKEWHTAASRGSVFNFKTPITADVTLYAQWRMPPFFFLGSSHTHTFAADWTYDETNHWRASSCGHPELIMDEAAHTFADITDCTLPVTCAVCAYEKPAGQHAWGDFTIDTADTTKHTHTCTVCSATESLAHTWGEWVTDDATGNKTRTCTDCPAEEMKAFGYTSPEEIQTAIANGATEIVVAEGTYGNLEIPDLPLTINGGIFSGYIRNDHIQITLNDGTFSLSYIWSDNGSVVINGGTYLRSDTIFYGDPNPSLTITGGTFAFNPTSYLADGYIATQVEDGMWTVTAE